MHTIIADMVWPNHRSCYRPLQALLVTILVLSCCLYGCRSLHADEGGESTADSMDEQIQQLLAPYAEWEYLSGRLQDQVTRLDDEEAPPNEYRIDFWLGTPDRYHFIVHDNAVAEDRQHYVSDGTWRWHVEVMLDDEMVDHRRAQRDDDFAQVQRLLQLNYAQLCDDFRMELLLLSDAEQEILPAWQAPEEWHIRHAVILYPLDEASDLKHMVLMFDAEGSARGLVSDDHHGNRRLVSIEELQRHDTLDAALFAW